MERAPTVYSVSAGKNSYSVTEPETKRKKCSAGRIFGVAFIATLAIAALVAICVILIFKIPQPQGSESNGGSGDVQALRQEIETVKQLVNSNQVSSASESQSMKVELNALMEDSWRRINSTIEDLHLLLHASKGDLQSRIDDGMYEVSRANDAFQQGLDSLKANLSDSFLSFSAMIDEVSQRASQETLTVEVQLTNFSRLVELASDITQVSAEVDNLSDGLDTVNLDLEEIRSNHSKGMHYDTMTWANLEEARGEGMTILEIELQLNFIHEP